MKLSIETKNDHGELRVIEVYAAEFDVDQINIRPGGIDIRYGDGTSQCLDGTLDEIVEAFASGVNRILRERNRLDQG